MDLKFTNEEEEEEKEEEEEEQSLKRYLVSGSQCPIIFFQLLLGVMGQWPQRGR